jgi:hypothetical protein
MKRRHRTTAAILLTPTFSGCYYSLGGGWVRPRQPVSLRCREVTLDHTLCDTRQDVTLTKPAESVSTLFVPWYELLDRDSPFTTDLSTPFSLRHCQSFRSKLFRAKQQFPSLSLALAITHAVNLKPHPFCFLGVFELLGTISTGSTACE